MGPAGRAGPQVLEVAGLEGEGLEGEGLEGEGPGVEPPRGPRDVVIDRTSDNHVLTAGNDLG